MEIKDIKNFINFVAKSGAAEVTLELKDLKISVKNELKKSETVVVQPTTPTVASTPTIATGEQAVVATPQQPAATPTPDTAGEASAEEGSVRDGYEQVLSPMVGTFYSRQNPEKPAFAKVGDVIKKGDVVCVVEAMKIFNEIEAEVAGKIVEVLVQDGTAVDYGTPLFLVEPQ